MAEGVGHGSVVRETRAADWGESPGNAEAPARPSTHFMSDGGSSAAADEDAEFMHDEDKETRRERSKEGYNEAVRKKERKEETRKLYAAQPTRVYRGEPGMGCGYPNRFMPRGGGSTTSSSGGGRSSSAAAPEEVEEEEETTGLEPLFFDEAEALADHAAAEEKRKRKVEEELEEARNKELLQRRWKAHMSVLDSITGYNHKHKCPTYTRFHFTDLSTFDLDEESPLGPMRYTDAAIEVDATGWFKQGEKRFLPCLSVNVLSIKVASLNNVGFPINLYGTILARDNLDLKCVYIFRRDRENCQLLNSQDDLLLLTGPKRGLALIDAVYFEMNLMIKGDQGQKDKQLSKGYLAVAGAPRRQRDKMKVESDSLDIGKHGTVELMFAAVNCAVEATMSIEVIQGEFHGEITACTTSIQKSIVLHDSKMAGAITWDGTGPIQLMRNVVAVSLKEKLQVTAQTSCGTTNTIEFTPRASGGDLDCITCGPIEMRVEVSWSIIKR